MTLIEIYDAFIDGQLVVASNGDEVYFGVEEIEYDGKNDSFTVKLIHYPTDNHYVIEGNAVNEYDYEVVDTGCREFKFRGGNHPNRKGQNIFGTNH